MRGGDSLHALIIIARKRKMGLSLTSHVKFHMVHSPLSVRLEWRMYDIFCVLFHPMPKEHWTDLYYPLKV